MFLISVNKQSGDAVKINWDLKRNFFFKSSFVCTEN